MTNDELNKYMAEKVMGYDPNDSGFGGVYYKEHMKDGWYPASDMNQAMMCVHKLGSPTFHIWCNYYDDNKCTEGETRGTFHKFCALLVKIPEKYSSEPAASLATKSSL